MRKFEMRSLTVWKWEIDVSLVKSKDVRVKRENDRKEMTEIKWVCSNYEFLGNDFASNGGILPKFQRFIER